MSELLISTLLHEEGPTGVQSHFNALARSARDVGLKVSVVTPFSFPLFAVYPLFAVRCLLDRFSGPASVWWYRFWHEFFLTAALRTRLRRQRDAIIYAQCPLSARAALKARRHPDEQRVVLVVHFNISQADEWADKGRISRSGALFRSIKRQEKEIIPRVDGLIFVSNFMRQQLTSDLPEITSLPTLIAPNFASSEALTHPSPNMTVDLLSVGTLEPRKNQRFLLHVLARAKELGHNYTLALVGDGPDRQMLELEARRLQISDQVRFLGYVPKAASTMRGARVYIHGAKLENCPIAVVEAMANALPIAALSSGGTPELVDDGVEGILWPDEDADVAARSVIALLQSAELRSQYGVAARSRYERQFSSQVVAARLLAFLCARSPFKDT